MSLEEVWAGGIIVVDSNGVPLTTTGTSIWYPGNHIARFGVDVEPGVGAAAGVVTVETSGDSTKSSGSALDTIAFNDSRLNRSYDDSFGFWRLRITTPFDVASKFRIRGWR